MRRATSEHWLLRGALIATLIVFIAFFLIFPVFVVVFEAVRHGWALYWSALTDTYSVSAIKMTLLVALAVVPMNTIFGISAAWAVTRFNFRGKALLISLIEIPLWVSPVIAVSSSRCFLEGRDFSVRGSMRTTSRSCSRIRAWCWAPPSSRSPFVARGLIPLMQAQGSSEEEAALTLGANGWQLFWRVTFPKIRWGILYGMILCNARAMGEFGAVSVVAGSVDNKLTMPLQIEQFFLNFGLPQAFALASLLLLLTAVTLVVKIGLEWLHLAPTSVRLH